ncbi:hypothetical protein ACFX2I_020026 [Malus domestica]
MEEPKLAEPTATEILTTPPSSTEILHPQPPLSSLPSRTKKRPLENDAYFSNSSTLYRDQLLRCHLTSRLIQIGVTDVFTVPSDFYLTLLDDLVVELQRTNDYRMNRILNHIIGLPDFSQELRCFQTVTCYQAVVNNLEDALRRNPTTKRR